MSSRAAAKARTREALIDAGLALIAKGGIDAPSLDAICERAGKTRGAFYVHFRDREDFLDAAMDHVGRRFLDAVLPPPTGSADGAPGDDLARMTLRFVASVADGSYPLGPAGGVRPHQLLAACARSPRLRRRYVGLVLEAIARVERLVVLGQASALVRADLPAGDVAVMLLAATIGAHTLLELRAPIDLSRSAGLAVRALAANSAAKPAAKTAKPAAMPTAPTRRGSASASAAHRARAARPTTRRPASR